MKNKMRLLSLLFMSQVLYGCSSHYKLVEVPEERAAIERRSLVCEETGNNTSTNSAALCVKFGLALASDKSCQDSLHGCARVSITETYFATDFSPGIVLFLGLIPAKQAYNYEIIIRYGDTGVENELKRVEYQVIESWGSINTILSILGATNSLESEQRKIGEYLKARYGESI